MILDGIELAVLNKNKLKYLSKTINYNFTNEKLLHLALSHCSIGENNNERLEFLGDAVLNFLISTRLYELFPKAKEGNLTCMRAQLVKGDTLAKIAKEMRLGDYLYLGLGEKKSGGYQRNSILADALEAIIGAIYLDSNIESVKSIVLPWFKNEIDNITIIEPKKDAKTRLQEFMQSRKNPLPEYEIIKIIGEQHAQEFHVACYVSLLEEPLQGVANSRRKAEQLAAEAVLKLLDQCDEFDDK